jgi:hypothetical protein
MNKSLDNKEESANRKEKRGRTLRTTKRDDETERRQKMKKYFAILASTPLGGVCGAVD